MTLLWQIGAGIVLALAVALGVQSCRVDRLQDKIASTELAAQRELTRSAQEIVKLGNQMNLKAREAQQTQAVADEKYETVMAELRTSKRRLRDRFTCPRVSEGPSGSDGGEARGLLREDAEFLISESKRADDVTRQLQLAQEVIRAYEQVK